MLLLVALAAACGGGGGVDTGGTGATVSSYSVGRISGFGSIVVNGVHFDESGASIVDDDGAPRGRDELQLGMTVNIDAGPVTTDAEGTANSTASRVEFGADIRGPVDSVDVAGNTLHVLGQTVNVDVNTVIADPGGSLAAIHAGDVVQVFAFLDTASGAYTATRLERQGALPLYRLRGVIASLDTAAKTFRIGTAVIDYGGIAAADLPGLADGAIAKVDLQTTQRAGRWIATSIRTPLAAPVEGAATELEGFVNAFTSLSDFQVGGVRVDASGPAVVFDVGTAADIANGARIEVEGHLQGGVLTATRIEVRKPNDGGNRPEPPQEFDLHGAIESLDASARTFVVHGTRVTFDATTTFARGSVADLAVGKGVDVKGVLATGNQVRATRIKFDK